MLNGLVLFAKTGGTTLALENIVRPVAYHEPKKYNRNLLFSRMADENIPLQAVCDTFGDTFWFNKPTFNEEWKREGRHIDIIHGSLPTEAGYTCTVRRELGEESRGLRDGSNRGRNGQRRKYNLEGTEPNLYEQIYELAKEIQPKFLFFEFKEKSFRRSNSLTSFVYRISELGYDCRWDTLSAYDMGSPQKRERIYLLARKREESDRKLNRDFCDIKRSRSEITYNMPNSSRTAKRTPKRVAEVKAGLDEVCMPQYREAFLRLVGLK